MISARGIFYKLTGPKTAPTLVFSNSLGTDMSMWDAQLKYFQTDFQILQYDTRGHGGSHMPRGNSLSIEELGVDLLEVMDECQIQKTHFCGISLGGFTGIWLGAHHPERLFSLTLANTSPKIASPDIWANRIQLVQKEGLAPVAQASASRWFTEDFISSHPEQVKVITENLLRTSADGYTACCEVLRTTNLWDCLPQIKCHSLIISGQFDPVTTVKEGQTMHELIPESRLCVLPASHLSNIESAPLFNQTLADFLRDLR